jgi:hypothetical protein
MEQEHYLSFGSFRLDTVHGHPWQGNHSMPLRPRTLAMLCYLSDDARARQGFRSADHQGTAGARARRPAVG